MVATMSCVIFWCYNGVMLRGCRLYATHLSSAVDYSFLRTGTRIMVSSAHLFGMPQVWEPLLAWHNLESSCCIVIVKVPSPGKSFSGLSVLSSTISRCKSNVESCQIIRSRMWRRHTARWLQSVGSGFMWHGGLRIHWLIGAYNPTASCELWGCSDPMIHLFILIPYRLFACLLNFLTYFLFLTYFFFTYLLPYLSFFWE